MIKRYHNNGKLSAPSFSIVQFDKIIISLMEVIEIRRRKTGYLLNPSHNDVLLSEPRKWEHKLQQQESMGTLKMPKDLSYQLCQDGLKKCYWKQADSKLVEIISTESLKQPSRSGERRFKAHSNFPSQMAGALWPSRWENRGKFKATCRQPHKYELEKISKIATRHFSRRCVWWLTSERQVNWTWTCKHNAF